MLRKFRNMKAAVIILSRPRDFPIARECARMWENSGVRARILVDPAEWPEGKPDGTLARRYAPLGRMVGNDCHEAILDAMLDLDADVLAKTDCDTWLSPKIIRWLVGGGDVARTLFARDFKHYWGGVWAAERSQVAAMAKTAATIPRCHCAESHLAICGLRAHGGIEALPSVSIWAPGRPLTDAMTLPRKCPAPGRLECGLELFRQASAAASPRPGQASANPNPTPTPTT